LQNWNITNNSEKSRSSLFYGEWDASSVGISGDPGRGEDGEYQYYLWAGLRAKNQYLLAVRSNNRVELCSGFNEGIYVYGQSLHEYIAGIVD